MLKGLERKKQMKFWEDIVPENKKIRNFDLGVLTYRKNGNKMHKVDLQAMFSNLYEVMCSKNYLLNVDAKEDDYEVIYKALQYYIEMAHKENDNQFFSDMFYSMYEITLERLQAHLPALDSWHITALHKAINYDYVLPIVELETYNQIAV